MDALALADNLNRRGITITADGAKLIVRPSSRLTDQDRQAIRRYKPDLLWVLTRRASGEAATAHALIAKTFGKIEALREGASIEAHRRVQRVIGVFEPLIIAIVDKRDLETLHYCLIDFERNVRDAIQGRGYDNQ